eukprot:CAMPEP_0115527476 /NCGR_PEP_ID=MMETSP0271-20121206/82866_1 /TAXON_ID=71861 /ORGANISM="Scrippsiella trochoidea, Strain CCMP3099" /LENGTH=65 /DNA_ID=CAMNT_0002959309 /DNA_START=121 /DNA_END=314 /DNA_ORIENTATION=+
MMMASAATDKLTADSTASISLCTKRLSTLQPKRKQLMPVNTLPPAPQVARFNAASKYCPALPLNA